MTVGYDLWTEASRDAEADEASLRMTRAKVATASLWPFLALAQSEREFEHRLALTSERLAQRVEPDLLEPLIASLREDFLVTASEEDDEDEEPDKDDGEWQKPWEKEAAHAPLQVFHVASGRWLTVQADSPMTRDNPKGNDAYFENELEEGPNTGQTGQYPVAPAGPDPVDPINSMFPMQPSAWTPNNAWVEQPMNFAPYKSAAGNPNFFAGGPEGVSGEPQSGFPADVALPEPDERVDMYGTTPPLQSGGTTGDGHPYSNPAVASRRPFGEGFFDPGDTSVRVLAVGGPYGSGNRYNSSGSEVGQGSGTAPQPPPSMMPGGAGSEAMPPLSPAGEQGGQSTSDMAAKQQNPMDQMTARRIASDVMQRPTTDNPGGVADEYEAKTWDGATTQRPMQPAEHRNVNTPQRPSEPIGQNSSEGMEAEEGRRAAGRKHMAELFAARVVSSLSYAQGVAA